MNGEAYRNTEEKRMVTGNKNVLPGFLFLSGGVSVILFCWALVRGIEMSSGMAWFFLSFPAVAAVWGEAVLRAAAPCREKACVSDYLMEFAVGVCTLNLVLLALAFTCPGTITWHYAILCMGACALLLRFRRQGTASACSWKVEGLVLAFSFIAISGLAYYTLSLCSIGEKKVHFTGYLDLFLHASLTASFSGNPQDFGNYSVLGMPMLFYHYASYLIPALFCRASGASALDAVACFMIPLGFLTMAAAAFAAARRALGTAAGLSAVWVLLALPDSSVLPTSHAHLSFFAYALICPTMPYAIAQALIAFTLLQQGLETGGTKRIVLALFLSLTLLLVKSHFVLFFFPVTVAYAVLKYPTPGWRRKCLLLGILSVLGTIAFVAAYALMPQYGVLGTSGAGAYVAYLCKIAQPQNMLFFHLREMNPGGLRTLLGLLLVIVATFGLLLPWYGVTLLWKHRTQRLNLDDMLPGVYLLVYGLALVLLPLCKVGDSFEFQHRPHVFVYAWMAFYCAGQTMALLARTRLWNDRPWIGAAAVAVLLGSLLLPWMTRDHYQNRCHATRMRGNYSIDRGLWDCAQFIRKESAPGDVYVDSLEDPMGIAAGLTDRRALVSRVDIYNQIEHSRDDIRRAVSIHEALRGAADKESLQKTAKEHGVRWYLLNPEGVSVKWPDEILQHAAFSSQGYRVYDLYDLVPQRAASDK